jgi:hypothetical protein
MKSQNIETFKKNFPNYLFVLSLFALIAVFSFFLLGNIRAIHRQNISNQHRTLGEFFSNHKISVNDVDFIEGWMTFRYINHIFNLPESFLKTRLNIEDVNYPNIPLGRFAKSANIDSSAFLANIKDILRKYLQQNPINKK